MKGSVIRQAGWRAVYGEENKDETTIPGWQEAVDSVLLTEDEQYVMNDRIVERFAERSVGVENFIHDARNLFDRAAPWLALAVLALFAVSVLYTGSL